MKKLILFVMIVMSFNFSQARGPGDEGCLGRGCVALEARNKVCFVDPKTDRVYFLNEFFGKMLKFERLSDEECEQIKSEIPGI